MKGKVLTYDFSSHTGLISADDGHRYTFSGPEWNATTAPSIGAVVDFEADQQTAKSIFPMTHGANAMAPMTSSKRIPACLFAFFLGVFGAHKFYLGMTKPAVIMLCVWLFGWILIGIPSLVIGIIAFVEFIIYLTRSDAEFEQRYVVGRKEWF